MGVLWGVESARGGCYQGEVLNGQEVRDVISYDTYFDVCSYYWIELE